jgi:hypothetical protein
MATRILFEYMIGVLALIRSGHEIEWFVGERPDNLPGAEQTVFETDQEWHKMESVFH